MITCVEHLWRRYLTWRKKRQTDAQERDRQFDLDSETLLLSIAESPDKGERLIADYRFMSREERSQFIAILRDAVR